jgi:hypothetical protein
VPLSKQQVAVLAAMSAGREARLWPSLACWECQVSAACAGDCRREAALRRLGVATAGEFEEVVIRSEVGSERSRWEKDMSVPQSSR